MKHSIINILAVSAVLSAVLSAVSCRQEIIEMQTPQEQGLVEISFEAGPASDSKTTLTAEKNIEWTAGDQMSVFDGLRNRCFTTKDAGATAVFTGIAKETDRYYAVYPYDADAQMTDPGVITTEIPSTQYAQKNGFGQGANVAVGTSEGSKFSMKNVCGYIRLDISGCSKQIMSVTIDAGEGNYLSGQVSIDATASVPSVSVLDGYRKVVLRSTRSDISDGCYYITAVPGVKCDSLVLKFVSKEGEVAELKTDGISIARNTDKDSRLAVNLSTVSWNPPVTEELTIRFLTEKGGVLQPFLPDITRTHSGGVNPAIDGDYTFNGYPVHLRFSTSCSFNSTTGFNFATKDNHIVFPAIPGKALKKVNIRFQTASGPKNVSIRKDGDIVAGGEPKAGECAAGDTVSWTISEPEYDKAYSLNKENSTATRLMFINLVYSGLDILAVKSVELEDSEIISGNLDVNGFISVNDISLGRLSWGVEYRPSQSDEWKEMGKGLGQTIAASLENSPADTLVVRAWAKADDFDRVYSQEKTCIWTHPQVDSINVKKVTFKAGTLAVNAELEGKNFDKGNLKWAVEYKHSMQNAWIEGAAGEGKDIDVEVKDLKKDSLYVRIWAQADKTPVVYSDIITVEEASVNIQSVSVDKAFLRSGKLKFAGTVTAENPTAGEVVWGMQYKTFSASQWQDGPQGTGVAIKDSLSGVSGTDIVVRLWAQADGAEPVYSPVDTAVSRKAVALSFTTDAIEYVKTYGMGAAGDEEGVDPTFPTPLPTSSNKRSTVRPLPLDNDGKSDTKKKCFDEFKLKTFGDLPWGICGSFSGASGRQSVSYYFSSSQYVPSAGSVITIPAIEGYIFDGFELKAKSGGSEYIVSSSYSTTSVSYAVTEAASGKRPKTAAGTVTSCTSDSFVGSVKVKTGVQYYLWLLKKDTYSNITYYYEPCE